MFVVREERVHSTAVVRHSQGRMSEGRGIRIRIRIGGKKEARDARCRAEEIHMAYIAAGRKAGQMKELN